MAMNLSHGLRKVSVVQSKRLGVPFETCLNSTFDQTPLVVTGFTSNPMPIKLPDLLPPRTKINIGSSPHENLLVNMNLGASPS